MNSVMSAHSALRYHVPRRRRRADLLRPQAREKLDGVAAAFLSGALARPQWTDPMAQTQTGSDLVTRFERAAAEYPARPAIEYEGRNWSYAQLEAATAALAARLVALGAGSQRIAVIHAERNPLVVLAMMACVRARLTFHVLGENQPEAYAARTLEDVSDIVWLGATGDADALRARRIAGARLTAFVPLSEADLDARPVDLRAPQTRTDYAMYLVATSGTTGRAKRVLTNERAVVNFIEWYTNRFAHSCEDRFSLLSGIGADPLIRDVFTPLSIGATIEIPLREALGSRHALQRWVKERRISVVHATPQLAQTLFGTEHTESFGSLRLVAVGGATLTANLAGQITSRLSAGCLVNVYGTTETPQVMTYHVVAAADAVVDSDEAHGAVPIGEPISGVYVQVLSESGLPLPEREVGEIEISTPYLADGYFQTPELTRQKFGFSDRFQCTSYRTGDLGYVDRDGQLHFVGRKDRQVKYRGYRVQLEEIECALCEIEEIAAAAVVHGQRVATEELTAYVVPRAGATVDIARLRRRLSEHLPAHALPTTYIALASLPLTATNKVDYGALAAAPRIVARSAARTLGFAQARVAGELRSIWAEVLGAPATDITPERNFFEIGGTSLLSARVVEHINRRLSQALTLTDLFVYPNISALSEYIESKDGPTAHFPESAAGSQRSQRRASMQLRKKVREEI
jgi:amino acid adenylation domain-containing protein